jgi:phage baseplate assembly protein W
MPRQFKLPTNDVKKLPIGLALPLAPNSTNLFAINYTTAAQYKTNIRNLIMTTTGERRMVPQFGSMLRKRIFDQSSNMAEELQNDVETSMNNWLPEVKIDNINILQDSTNEHAFLIKMQYSLPFSIVPDNVNLEVTL